MRIGLIGNGYWARVTHAAGIAAEPSVSFAGVWGRDRVKSNHIAEQFGVAVYDDVDELFADVDAVAFSVPPNVQSELALRAARLGKHLLLEKPIATSLPAARQLADTVAEAGVASVVFFTGRFDMGRRTWTDRIAAQQGWDGASGLWLGSAFVANSPFDTQWRHEKGGLWDVGPHVLAMLIDTLGPIERLTACSGPRDLVHLVARHSNGAVSGYALGIDNPSLSRISLSVWGEAGIFELPSEPLDSVAALSNAARELAIAARLSQPVHPSDVRFGLTVVTLLVDAERQLDA